MLAIHRDFRDEPWLFGAVHQPKNELLAAATANPLPDGVVERVFRQQFS